MEKNRTDLVDGADASLEYVRRLCQLPFAAGAERLLWIQRTATVGLFRSCLSVRTALYFDWYRDGARIDEPLSMVCAAVRRPAVGPFDPFYSAALLRRVFDRACHAGGYDGICTKHESHRAGNG